MAWCFLSMILSLLLPFKSWLVYQNKDVKVYFLSWDVINCLQYIELHTYSRYLILLFISFNHGECKPSCKFCKVLMQKITFDLNALKDYALILSPWAKKHAWCIKTTSVLWSVSRRDSFKVGEYLKQWSLLKAFVLLI